MQIVSYPEPEPCTVPYNSGMYGVAAALAVGGQALKRRTGSRWSSHPHVFGSSCEVTIPYLRGTGKHYAIGMGCRLKLIELPYADRLQNGPGRRDGKPPLRLNLIAGHQTSANPCGPSTEVSARSGRISYDQCPIRLLLGVPGCTCGECAVRQVRAAFAIIDFHRVEHVADTCNRRKRNQPNA